jgi:hypothetical protein
MLHHGRKGHGERTRQIADRGGTVREPLNHRTSRRIGESLKGEVERGRLVKHALKYHDYEKLSNYFSDARPAAMIADGALFDPGELANSAHVQIAKALDGWVAATCRAANVDFVRSIVLN